MTNDEFWTWVDSEMARLGLNYHRIEMMAGLSNAAISKQARNWSRPTMTACLAIAQAFGLPGEHVLRLAGHLPPRPDPSGLPPQTAELIREMNELLLRQPEPEQRRIMTAVLMLLRGAEVTVTPLDEP